jgi:hypothetical protein
VGHYPYYGSPNFIIINHISIGFPSIVFPDGVWTQKYCFLCVHDWFLVFLPLYREWFFSLLPRTISNWDVLETLFSENFIPNFFNVVSHPPSPIWTKDNEETDLEEKPNKILEYFFESIHTTETKNNNSNLQVQDFNFSCTPYEDILRNNFENEIEDPPKNSQEYFSQHNHVENVTIDDENSQENWHQEKLVE